jgi:hypothetical protein
MAQESSSRVRAARPANGEAERGKVISFGELVAAAFDRAEVVTTDPGVAATLATRTVGRWLGRTGRPDIADRLGGPKRSGRRTPFSRAA